MEIRLNLEFFGTEFDNFWAIFGSNCNHFGHIHQIVLATGNLVLIEFPCFCSFDSKSNLSHYLF